MSTYRVAHEAESIVTKLVKKHYPDLAQSEVTFLVLFAHAARDDAGEPKGPALKWAGYPALAMVKINSLKDRVAGLPDATIQIDGDQWPDWSDAQREALIDHELMHVGLKRADGFPQSDDIGRPKLKIRLHDFQVGGFYDIIRRHEDAAFESKALDDIWRELKQHSLPFPEMEAVAS